MAQFESKVLLLHECISAALFITFQRLHYFEMCLLLFDFFFLIINREPHGVVFVSINEKRLQKQAYRQIIANLWIHLDLAKVHYFKGLTSLNIISYLHFPNLNNILTLPQTFVIAEAWFGLTQTMFALFFACQIYSHGCQFMKSKQMQAAQTI